jgi:sensor histidine kinase YesM
VMHMRMPDRLKFALHVADGAANMQCPPMTLLTLVENAIRHGIDPSEAGGRIDIDVQILPSPSRCQVCVTDTGVGLQPMGRSLGTGLSSLRERLQLTYGREAVLSLHDVVPHGVRAELSFPARPAGI